MTKKIYLLLPVLMMFFISSGKGAVINQGDTLSFWSVSYIDWLNSNFPPQKQIKAACRYIAKRSYVFTDVLYKDSIQQSKAELFANTLDSVYYSLTDLYGPVPDALDNDPRIYILASAGEWWGGYFDPTHQMPDTMTMRLWGMHSSEKEIIFLNGNVINSGAVSALAHEFGHMLHWGQDHSPEPPEAPVKYWEDTWVDEGFSTFAEIYLTEKIGQKDVYFERPFFSTNYGVPLIYFESYSASRLFMLYMYEHYGKENYIRSLISNQLNGIEGVSSTINYLGYKDSFEEVFHNFILANLLDRQTNEGDKYFYNHYNFPQIKFTALQQDYPKVANGNLKAFATDYYRMIPTDSNDYVIHLDAGNDKTALSLVSVKAGSDPVVDDMFVESDGTGTINTNRFKRASDTLFIVVSNINRKLEEGKTEKYKLTIQSIPLSVADEMPAFDLYSDPVNHQIIVRSTLAYRPEIALELYDVMGRNISFTNSGSGKYKIDNGVSGFIFARIRSGNYSIVKKVFM